MNAALENVEYFLPRYLSADSQKELIDELRQFPENIDQRFYSSLHHPDIPTVCQGDAIKSLYVSHLESRSFYEAPCLILSNTCDTDIHNNVRPLPINVCYAPIFRLEKIHQIVSRNRGRSNADSFCESIRKQHISTYFYLPASGELDYEGVVSLDQVCNMQNSEEVYEELRKKRCFTLSNYGFYLLLFKLSIHFTRMREGIERNPRS